MPIIDQQRRLRELGRIRIGATETYQKNGKTLQRPTKLQTFRFTSQARELIEAAADRYGGDPHVWEGSPSEAEEWEVFTEADTIPILIQPGEVLQQYYEMWTGGGCQRRCDGRTEILTMKPCICADELGFDVTSDELNLESPYYNEHRQDELAKARREAAAERTPKACKPTTRLRVILAELPGVGTWRLESHGYYAAVELAGVAQLLEEATLQGRALPAQLGLDARQSKKPGQQTRRYVVPVIKVAATAGQVLEALGTTVNDDYSLGSAERAQLEAPRRGRAYADRVPLGAGAPELPGESGFGALEDRGPGLGPAPELPAQAQGRRDRPEVGGAAPAPSAAPVTEDAPPPVDGDRTSGSSTSPEVPETGSDVPWTEMPITDDQRRKIHAIYRQHGIDEATYRAALFASFEVTSHNDLTRGQLSWLIDRLEQTEVVDDMGEDRTVYPGVAAFKAKAAESTEGAQ